MFTLLIVDLDRAQRRAGQQRALTARRLERAEHLIGHGATVEAAARTVGFTDARMLRRLRAREPA